MVDIETLGVKSDAVILSIGVTGPNIYEFYTEIDIESQHGRNIEPNTLKFWLSQSIPIPITGSTSLVSALDTIKNLFSGPAEYEFWSRGSFDFDVLNHAYKSYALTPPWKYRNINDFRTVSKLFPNIKPPYENPIKHNALEDAKHQLAHLRAILKQLESHDLSSIPGTDYSTIQRSAESSRVATNS